MWEKNKRSSIVINYVSLFNSSDMFLLLYVTEKFGGAQSAITAYIVYNVSMALSAYPLGRVADATSLKRIVALGVLLIGTMYAALPFVSSFTSVLVLFIMYGIGYAAFESNAKAWVSRVVSSSDIGVAMGVFSGTQSIALLSAGIITGAVWHFDASLALFITGVMSAVSAAWIIRTREPHIESAV